MLGFPAGVTELKDDSIYFVNLAETNISPGQTNYIALLQEILVTEGEYRHIKTNRFFELPFWFEQGRYYRVSKSGTNASRDEIPRPVP